MSRFLVLGYAILAYALFLVTLLYAVGFIGGFLAPTRLDDPRGALTVAAVVTDLGLLGLFAVQHSGMARPGFKRWLTRFVPVPAERATYVLLSSVALLTLFALWQPVGGVIWEWEGTTARSVVAAVAVTGWLLVLWATFLIDHFDLFGLRQAWLHYRGVAYTPPSFVAPMPYRVVRHPLYVGWLTAFWAAPTMTASHLLFAAGCSVYILAAIRWEERDLTAAHPEYAAYRDRVPMLVPRVRGRQTPILAAQQPEAG